MQAVLAQQERYAKRNTTPKQLLTRFICDAAEFREYCEVIWAVTRYRQHFPPDVEIETSAATAYAAVGDETCAAEAFARARRLRSGYLASDGDSSRTAPLR
jgi:hypothetical protein